MMRPLVETPADQLMREALLEYSGQIEGTLAVLNRLPPELHANALAQLIVSTANAQLILVRLLTKSYH